ncbi:MAG: hypothetical protein ACPGXL_05155 [Chitinophagales bacterium]
MLFFIEQTIHWEPIGLTRTLIGIFALVLLLVSAYLVWKQPRRRWFRAICYLGVLVSLLVIACRPYTTQSTENGEEVVLLSQNFQDTNLQALLDSIGEQIPIYFLQENDTLPSSSSIYPSISNVSLLLHAHRELKKLHILGDGIPTEQLPQLANMPTEWQLNDYPEGIQEIYWTHKVQQGKPLIVEGSIYNPSGQQVTLFLEMGQNQMDTLKSSQKRQIPFRLTGDTKLAGRFLDALVVKIGATTQRYPIPYRVLRNPEKQILIISTQPSFEIKFLKNWLSEQGYGVAIRSQISKDKFRYEHLNRSEQDLKTLNKTLLAQFDWLIADHLSIDQMETTTKTVVEAAIEEEGMSLLVLADEKQLRNANRNKSLLPMDWQQQINGNKQAKTSLQFEDKISTIEVSPLDFKITPEFGSDVIFKTSNDNIICISKQKGLGKSAISLLPKTYTWQLKGEKASYETVWTHISEKMLVNYEEETHWLLPNPVPCQGERFLFELLQPTLPTSQKVELVMPNGQTKHVAMSEQLHRGRYQGIVMVGEQGWHKLQLNGGDIADEEVYIFSKEDWQNIRQTKRMVTNKQFAKKQNSRVEQGLATTLSHQKHYVDLTWIFMLFLMSMAGLWLEPKF